MISSWRESEVKVTRDTSSMLHALVRKALQELGYTSLLPVQEKAIPVVLSGQNTLIVAPTGSGKTEAALLPVMSMILQRSHGRRGVKAVYVTPLRALNRDIEWRMKRLAEQTGLSLYVRHGDSTQSVRRRFQREPPDIVVTTPESLNLMVATPQLRRLWRTVRHVIIDEVHELIDSKRGVEFSVTLERLALAAGTRVQRIGLSATLSKASITEAGRLISGSAPFRVVEDRSAKRYDVRVSVVWSEEKWNAAIRRIAGIIRESQGQVLVFTNTRSTAEMLGAELAKILGEDKVAVHHGSLSRRIREEAEKEFKTGSKQVLVATSSMELGIDVGAIDLVVQFMSPRQVLSMVQRTGRSGHRFGDTSRGVIVTIGNLYEVMESTVIAYRAMKGSLEDLKAPRRSLDVLAHQMAGMVIEGTAETVEDVYMIASSAYPFHDLSLEEAERVAMHLDSVRVLRYRDGRLSQSGRSRSYFYRVSMIPDDTSYRVVDVVTGETVGELGERFIEAEIMRLEEDERKFRFILSGRVWEALDIDVEAGKVTAKPIGLVEGSVPSWEGELIPVDYKVAREVCGLLSLGMVDPEAFQRIMRERGLDKESIHKILEVLSETEKAWGLHLSAVKPVVEQARDDAVILYTCLGSKGNYALALLLSNILENRVKTEFSYIPYAVVFTSPGRLPARLIAEALAEAKRLSPAERRVRVYSSLRKTTIYLIRLLHVSRRLGVIDPDSRVPFDKLRRLREALQGSVVDEETIREVAFDKLDMEAVDNLLDDMEEPVLVQGPSRLAEEVLDNPYIKKDAGVNLKALALEQIIKGLMKRMERKTLLLQCVICGNTWLDNAASASSRMLRCPKCNSAVVAPLPDTEWGRETAEAYKRYIKNGKPPRGMKKRIEEVKERGSLYLAYASQGMGRKVIEALMMPGIGVERAKRVLMADARGPNEFYKALVKAMEDYASNRKYWRK